MSKQTTETKKFHTFPNGDALYASEVHAASEQWLATLAAVFLDRENPVAAPGDLYQALTQGVLAATATTQKTGGIPTSLYMLMGGDRGSLAPLRPGMDPEQVWHPLARNVFAHELRRVAAERGNRFIVHIGVDLAELTYVDDVEQAGTKVTDKEGALVLRITAFDLHNDNAARWWANIAPTGDTDKPLHILPLGRPVNREPFDWQGHFTNLSEGDLRELGLGAVLVPGVELLSEPRFLEIPGQVDLRWLSIESSMRQIARHEPEIEDLAQVCLDLQMHPKALKEILQGWSADPGLQA